MAEAMLTHLGAGQFEAFSAGSQPAGFVHPLAVECMKRMEIPMREARSKSWDEFRDTPMDLVITLCDSAAAETCPVFPESPMRVHWSLPDPVYHPGTPEERLEFAMKVASRLRAKIEGLAGLDWTAGRERIMERLKFLAEI
jgi:arsenate reductase